MSMVTRRLQVLLDERRYATAPSRRRTASAPAGAGLGAFDGVLAAAALERGAEALVSAARGFDAVRGPRFVALGSPECAELLAAAAD